MTPASLLSDPRTKPAPSEEPSAMVSRRRWAEVGIVIICVLVWFTYSGSRSPWLKLNLPGGVHGGNPASGYTSLYNGDFHHKENFYALQHIDLLKGNYESFRERIEFCDRRMFYGIAGNVLAILFNPYHALRLLNLFAFLLCAFLVRRMAEQLFGDPEKGLLASALFALSTLATVHVGDISPHFVALAFYYGWGLMMVRLADRLEPISPRENLGYAAYLGLWSLTYTSFAYGLVIYLLMLARRREWRNIAAPIVACVVMPQLQLLVVRMLGFGHATDIEKILATRGLAMHLENFREAGLSYAAFLLVEFVNYLFNDNPLNVLVGLLVLIGLRHRSKRVLALLYLVPIAVVFPFVGTSTARGYVVAGNTIVLFPLVAHGLIEAARWTNRRFGTFAGRGVIATLLLVQLGWGQGSLVGWLFPTGAYAMGIAKHTPIFAPTEYVPMTGDINDKPILHGGESTAAAAMGLDPHFGRQPLFAHPWRYPGGGAGVLQFLFGLAVQLPVILCLAGVVIFLGSTKWRRGMTVAMIVLLPGSLLFGAAEGVDPQAYLKFEDRIDIAEGETLTVRVQLSQAFREKLEAAAGANVTAILHLHFRAKNGRATKPAELKLFDRSTDENRLSIPLRDLLAEIDRREGLFECTLTAQPESGGLLVRSWQRNGPETERTAAVHSVDGEARVVEWFPSLEIRVQRGENEYPFKDLITRWDLTRPIGYVIVGY